MCRIVGVVPFAGLLFLTARAYVRGLVQQGTVFGNILSAQGAAIVLCAGLAASEARVPGFCIAKVSSETSAVIQAVIDIIVSVIPGKAAMPFHLPCDG